MGCTKPRLSTIHQPLQIPPFIKQGQFIQINHRQVHLPSAVDLECQAFLSKQMVAYITEFLNVTPFLELQSPLSFRTLLTDFFFSVLGVHLSPCDLDLVVIYRCRFIDTTDHHIMGFAPYKPLPCLVSLFSFGNGIDFALHQPDALSPGQRPCDKAVLRPRGSLYHSVCVRRLFRHS